MSPRKWFRLSRSVVASSTLLFLSASVGLMSAIQAQASAPATLAPVETQARPGAEPASGPFLTARSFALASAPSAVALADVNRDGRPDLIVVYPLTGKVTVFLSLGEGKFAAGVEYATGSHPTSVAVADLDGDGRQEVLVSDPAERTISVLSSREDGTLTLRQSIALGLTPVLLATGDFNADGKTDVLLTATTGNTLAVLLNDGQGKLQKPILSALAKSPTAIAVADLNRDEHADLSLANSDGTVTILLGTGSGQFHQIAEISVGSGSLSGIVAGEFAGSGKVSLAVTESATGRLSVLAGNGDGSFRAPQPYSVGRSPVSVVTADFDGDGIADLIAINQGANTFSVLGGNGDGTFKNAVDFVVGKSPLAAVVGDFDGDGRADLAVIDRDSQSVSVAIGNGDNTFQAARSYAAEIQPRAIASADLNGDKRPDLVVSNYCGLDASCSKSGTIDVFLAGENGQYELAHSYPVGAGPVAVSLLDVDGDGHADIVVLNRDDKTISILLARGEGSFDSPLTFSVAGTPISMAVGDFNKDGKPDLAVIEDCGTAKCSQPGSVEVLLGQGGGGFRSAFTYATGYSPTSIAVVDLNRDKNLDIVVANRCGHDAGCEAIGTATVLLGSANGKFAAAPEIALGNSPSSIALADLGGRGIFDLAVARSTDNSLAILRGNGDGTFQAPATYKVGAAPASIAIADFNGDGKPDLAVANLKDSTVTVLFGKGDGTLNSPITLPVGMGPESLTVVANGNHAGLVTANGNSGAATPGREFTVLSNVQPEGNPAGTSPSTTTLTQTPNSSSVNQLVTLVATVAGTATSAEATGTVTFNSTPDAILDCNGGTTATAPVVSTQAGSTATCVTHSLQALSQSITAVYSGDGTFATSSSSAGTQNVTPLAATFADVASSALASSVNQSVTFSAEIATGKDVVTPFAPAGSIAFTATGSTTPICSGVVAKVAAGTWKASCSTAALTPATYTITPSYIDDPNFTVSGATTLTQVVSPVSTTLNITASASPSIVNSSVTFTAALAAATTPIAPVGTVSFQLNGSLIPSCASVAVNSSGKWTCTVNNLTATSDAITASYAGDPNFKVPTPGSLTQPVKPISSTLTLAASAGPYSVGKAVTLTASLNAALTPIVPAGTVSITVNGVAPAGCVDLNIGTGTASCQTTFSIAQPYVVQAVYNGPDPNFTIASSVAQTLSVGKAAASAVALSSSANPSSVNQPVAFTLTLTPPAGGTVAPTGTVTFLQGTTALCTSPVAVVNNSATCNYAFKQKSGGIAITATYSGDANFAKATASPVTQVVQATGTSTGLASTPDPSTVNQAVTFTATVTPAILAVTGSTAPTGKVTFSFQLNGAPATISGCANPVPVTTTALVTTAGCAAKLTGSGSYLVTASYSGDGNFNGSTSAQTTQTVGAAASTVKLISSPAISTVDQQVTFTAGVSPTVASAGAPNPMGTVTFSYVQNGATVVLCTSAQPVVQKGTVFAASCTAPLLQSGTTTVVATYSGDANYQPATSQNLNQTVNETGTEVKVSTAIANPVTNAPVVDEPVSFTATVSPSVGGFTGGTNPVGTVTFTILQGGNPVNVCPNAIPVSTSATFVTTAVCSTSLPATGQYSVTATYSGDGNFLGIASSPVTETVSASSTTVNVTSSLPKTAAGGGSVVNQPVTFTASVLPAFAGSTNPTGTVTFTDSVTGTTLCTVTLSSGVAAPCTSALLSAGTHDISVVYTTKDNNFKSSSTTLDQPVNAAPTTVSVISSSGASIPTSIATQSVTFTATVNQTFPPGTIPTGVVTFTLTQTATGTADTTDPTCAPAPLNASGQATCVVVFSSAEQSGSVTVSASYAGDPNFVKSGGSVAQIVQNFTLAFSTPGPVTVYQGYSNITDPFTPVPIKATTVATGGFNDTLVATCVVTDPATPAVALSDPSCTPTGGQLAASGAAPYVITASPTAPVGLYLVTLTGADAKPPQLSHSTSFTVYVAPTTAALTLGPGASAVASVAFNTAPVPPATAPAATLNPSTITCGTIVTLTGTSANISGQVSCTGTGTSVAVTGNQTTVAVTITTLAPTNTPAVARSSGSIASAAFWGVPLIALLAWFARRKSPNRSSFRFLSMILLAVALANTIGCGANFTAPALPTGGTTPGTYLVQVVIMDSNGAKHSAVVPLTVN